MKGFMKSLKRQDGFTLVELMVVVAIIGILSAVAIPNFKKYQAKAKTSESRLQLSAAYTAETAFFSDFSMYAACLRYMGFDPAPEASSRYFAVGFETAVTIVAASWNSAVNSGMQSGVTGTANVCVNNSVAAADGAYFPAGKGVGGAISNTQSDLDLTALGDQATGNLTFTIGTAGVVDGAYTTPATAGSRMAIHTINNQKIISTVSQGY